MSVESRGGKHPRRWLGNRFFFRLLGWEKPPKEPYGKKSVVSWLLGRKRIGAKRPRVFFIL
jgi:hypothetical protein